MADGEIADVIPASASPALLTAHTHAQEFGKKCGECGAHAMVPRDGCEPTRSAPAAYRLPRADQPFPVVRLIP